MDVGFLEVSSASPSAIRLECGLPSFVVVVASYGVIVELQRCRRRQRFWCGVRFTVEVFLLVRKVVHDGADFWSGR